MRPRANPDPDPRPYTALSRIQRWAGYSAWRVVVQLLAGLFARRERRGFAAMPRGPWIMVGNHISHLDAVGLIWCSPRKVDIVATSELYDNVFLGLLLRMVDCVPLNRGVALRWTAPADAEDSADRPLDLVAVQRMRDRLRRGRILAVFPDGGIRSGKRSVLEGAAWPSGTAGLAIRAGVPVRPLLILGTDRLYVRRLWFRRGGRVVYWLGEPLEADPALSGAAQRDDLMRRCAEALRGMYQQVLAEREDAEQLVPRTAQERWKEAGLL